MMLLSTEVCMPRQLASWVASWLAQLHSLCGVLDQACCVVLQVPLLDGGHVGHTREVQVITVGVPAAQGVVMKCGVVWRGVVRCSDVADARPESVPIVWLIQNS
jgi:hypothetical protein